MSRRIRHAPFEPLESRTLLAAVFWDGGGNGTSWEDPLNWSNNLLPTAADDVTIDVAGSPNITLSSGLQSIHSLVLAESLSVNGGTLAVATSAALTGSLTVNGGTIANGTWDSTGGTFQAGSSTASTLNAVALNGDLLLPGGANLRIVGGLTLGAAGRVRLTGASANSLGFVGSQTLVSGTISLENTAALGFVGCVGSGTLTIGPGAAITGGRGVIGQNVFSAGNTALVVQGTIDSSAGAAITLNTSGTGQLTIAGTARVESGGSLSIPAAAWTATGALAASGGSTLTLGGTWSTTGTITVDSSTLNLGGTFTGASLANLARTGGQINITGTLNNASNTLTLGGTTGSWTLNGGTISGGVLAFAAGSTLLLTANNANTLSGVTLNNDLAIDTGNSLKIAGGLIMGTGVSIRFTGTGGATLGLAGTQTIAAGEFIFQNTGTSTLGLVGPGTVTLGPGVRISGGNGAIGPTVLGGAAGTLINQGTISANVSGQTLSISAGGGFTNGGTGTVEAAGGTLAIAGSVTNYASQTLTSGTWRVLAGSTLTFSPGAILTNHATIFLAADGAFAALTGLATNQGSLTLADGHPFNFMPANENFTNAASGTIIQSGSGSVLIPATINLDTPGGITASGGTFTIAGVIPQLAGGTLHAGTWSALDGGTIELPGLVTTNGATIILAGSGSIPAMAGLTTNTGTISLADGHAFPFAPAGGVFTNAAAGVLNKTGAGTSVIPSSIVLNNLGTVGVVAGTLMISAASPQITGTTLTGGTWRADGGTLELPISILTNAAAVIITGDGRIPSLDELAANSGSITLGAGGRFQPGALSNTGTLTLNAGGYLIASGPLTQNATVVLAGGALYLLGGGAWSGSCTFSAGGSLTVLGNTTFTAAATFAGAAGSINFLGGQSSIAGSLGAAPLSVSGGSVVVTGTWPAATTLAVSGGLAQFDSTGTFATLQLTGGTLTGAGDLTFTGAMTWSAGTMAGTGRTIVASTSALTFAGSATRTLSRPMENAGTIAWTGGNLTFDGGSLLNRANANLNISAPAGAWTAGAGGGSITNSGTITKTGSAASTISVALSNAGLVRLQGGILTLGGNGAHTGDFTLTSGKLILGGTQTCAAGADITGAGSLFVTGSLTTAGIVNLTGALQVGGAATLNGATTAGAAAVLAGGSLALVVNATVSSLINAGSLSLDAHTLTVSGAYTQTATGALSVLINGTATNQYGHIAAGGAARIAGTVNVHWGATVYPSDGATFDLVTGSSRTGTFASSNVDSLGPNRAFLFNYSPTAGRMVVRARIYDDGP
jgi:hypothetical protein